MTAGGVTRELVRTRQTSRLSQDLAVGTPAPSTAISQTPSPSSFVLFPTITINSPVLRF